MNVLSMMKDCIDSLPLTEDRAVALLIYCKFQEKASGKSEVAGELYRRLERYFGVEVKHRSALKTVDSIIGLVNYINSVRVADINLKASEKV